jgi:hypothetical protein
MKGKEKCEGVWCITNRTMGHHKDECPYFQKYVNTRALNPSWLFCEICKMVGHNPHKSQLMPKYQSTPRNLF